MNAEKYRYLTLTRLPARLSAEQTAWELGFETHEIPVLVKARMLKPLGKPSQNSTKYFAACIIQELRNDADWLDKACKVISQCWKSRNSRMST